MGMRDISLGILHTFVLLEENKQDGEAISYDIICIIYSSCHNCCLLRHDLLDINFVTTLGGTQRHYIPTRWSTPMFISLLETIRSKTFPQSLILVSFWDSRNSREQRICWKTLENIEIGPVSRHCFATSEFGQGDQLKRINAGCCILKSLEVRQENVLVSAHPFMLTYFLPKTKTSNNYCTRLLPSKSCMHEPELSRYCGTDKKKRLYCKIVGVFLTQFGDRLASCFRDTNDRDMVVPSCCCMFAKACFQWKITKRRVDTSWLSHSHLPLTWSCTTLGSCPRWCSTTSPWLQHALHPFLGEMGKTKFGKSFAEPFLQFWVSLWESILCPWISSGVWTTGLNSWICLRLSQFWGIPLPWFHAHPNLHEVFVEKDFRHLKTKKFSICQHVFSQSASMISPVNWANC